VKTAAFGAFISLLPGRDGLLHISKVGNGKRVDRVEDFLNVGDKVEVQIADIDNRGKIYLDKVLAEGEQPPAPVEGGDRPPREPRGDRGGDRGPRRDRGERSDRGPRPVEGEGEPAPAPAGEEGGEGGEFRRRRNRRD
jgi:polyribonucleotide nucleotidyltransferase